MLVLSRKYHEKIILRIPGRPNHVEVSVQDIRGGVVRIGIKADKDVSARRAEVDSRMFEANRLQGKD